MSRPPLHHQRTPSPNRNRSGKTREPRGKIEVDPVSTERYDIENTSISSREASSTPSDQSMDKQNLHSSLGQSCQDDASDGSSGPHDDTASKDSQTSGSPQHKRNDESDESIYVLWVLVFVVIAMLCSYLPFSGPGPDYHETQPLSRYELFSNDIKDLQHHFPSQKTRLWRTVIASSKHVLKEPNSTYPSVILLASQVQHPRLSFCIAEKIASSFVKSHGINPDQVPTTDIELIKGFEVSVQKLKLDKDIQTALQQPDGKAYIIQNLQTLSPQTALLLHGLCDGDNAPYKEVMILMTLEVKKTTPAMTATEIENYLTRLWTTPEVEYDKVSALMSRISNNLVILQHEMPANVEKACSVY